MPVRPGPGLQLAAIETADRTYFDIESIQTACMDRQRRFPVLVIGLINAVGACRIYRKDESHVACLTIQKSHKPKQINYLRFGKRLAMERAEELRQALCNRMHNAVEVR